MLRNLTNYVLGFVFPGDNPDHGFAQVVSLDIQMSPELLKNFKDTARIWEFARKVESNGKYRCSFRENDGTLRKPVRIKPDYHGSFVLYVSKDGKQIASYEIEFFSSIDQIAICSERIYGEKPGYSRSMNELEALGVISMDLEKQL